MNKFASTSLSFPACPDDVRFSLNDDILTIVTRKTNEENHKFSIVSQTEETINEVVHTVLKSDQGDTFYIVDNQFHCEDDRPAINMRRWVVDFDHSKPETLNAWAKIWMKKGLYHRAGDKPALIFKNGDLLWMENGHFKRNPFTNASVYLTEDEHAICFDRQKGLWDYPTPSELSQQKDQKLFDFKYETA